MVENTPTRRRRLDVAGTRVKFAKRPSQPMRAVTTRRARRRSEGSDPEIHHQSRSASNDPPSSCPPLKQPLAARTFRD